MNKKINKMKKIRIGITGNIGTGKSTVSEYYRQKGITVLDADIIAKSLYQKINIRKRVIAEFGDSTYDGKMPNYKNIAEIAFENEENLAKLNEIIHPSMISEIIRLMDNHLKTENIVMTEAAIMFEAGFEDIFDHVILLTAPNELKIERTMKRSGLSKEDVTARLEKQISEDIKKTHCDFVISNDSNIDSLNKKCDFIFTLINQI